MHTQSHVIMGAALFGGRMPRRAWLAALGGLLPDLPMLLIVLVLKLSGVPALLIFGVLYWQDWWQITNGIAHNFFLWSGLLLLCIVMRERISATARSMDRWAGGIVFAASGLLHSVVDFLVHRQDAHMSLWPLTRWKFVSPVSYWDGAHYGNQFHLFEAALGLFLAALLLARFRHPLVRVALVLAMLLYVAVPVFFFLQ